MENFLFTIEISRIRILPSTIIESEFDLQENPNLDPTDIINFLKQFLKILTKKKSMFIAIRNSLSEIPPRKFQY